MFCMKCGAQIEEGNAFCMKCGAKAPKMQPDVSRNAADSADFDDRTVMADSVFDGTSDYGSQANMMGQNVNSAQNTNNRTVPSVNTYNGAQASLNTGYQQNNNANSGKRKNFSSSQSKDAKQKKKGSTGLVVAIVFLVLSILAVLGVGGYFVYQTFIVDSQYEAVSIDDELSDLRKKKDKDNDSSSGEKKGNKSDASTEDEDFAVGAGAADENDAVAIAETTVVETTAETTAAFVPPAYALNYKEDYNLSGLIRIPVLNVTQSSYLIQKDTNYINYGSNAFDGDLKTSWQDGVSGDGINEWIKADLDRTYSVSALSFALGNHRSQDWYYKNNRPSILCITVGDCYYNVVFPDQYREFVVSFSEPIPADSIMVAIGGNYPGTVYNDMTIAEIGVYGN